MPAVRKFKGEGLPSIKQIKGKFKLALANAQIPEWLTLENFTILSGLVGTAFLIYFLRKKNPNVVKELIAKYGNKVAEKVLDLLPAFFLAKLGVSTNEEKQLKREKKFEKSVKNPINLKNLNPSQLKRLNRLIEETKKTQDIVAFHKRVRSIIPDYSQEEKIDLDEDEDEDLL